MSAAARVLRSWEPILEELTPELLGLLDRWVPRLASLVGPARHVDSAERMDPDGYSGFTNRGPPERLTLGEWAIREVHPDEFLRRALAGEQLHLRPAYREPVAARRALVLFDTGVAQLGAARLAHLALLLVLAERARASGGLLSWAALPEGGLIHTLDLPGDLGRLAGARSWAEGPWAVDAWAERIADIDDRFVVGGPELADFADALGARLLQVSELEETVEVQVGRRGRRARLPLADREAGAVALRTPLARDALPATSSRPPERRLWLQPRARTLVFSPSGTRLVFELDGRREVVAVKVGGSSRRSFRPQRVYLTAEELPLAATVYKKRLVVLVRIGQELRVKGLHGRDLRSVSEIAIRDPDLPEPVLGLGGAVAWALGDALELRYQLGPTERGVSDRLDRVLADRVLAFGRGPEGVRRLVPGEHGVMLQVEPTDGLAAPFERRVFEVPVATDGRLGPLGEPTRPVPAGCLAVKGQTGWWVLRQGLWDSERGSPERVETRPGEVVLGVGEFASKDLPGAALVLLLDEQRVVARCARGQVPLLTLATPPQNAVMDQARHQLAVVDGWGRALVYDLVTGRLRLEIHGEDLR